MNKKILTVLLALAMMLSMVAPMAVFAEDSCKHEHTFDGEQPNHTHAVFCDDCGKILSDLESCTYGKDGKCVICGGQDPTNCKHVNETYGFYPDGKNHIVGCLNCGKILKEREAHSFVNGVCSKCGYDESTELCEHKNTIWSWDRETETHYELCLDCGAPLTLPKACTYGDDGKCTICGGLKKICEHEKTHVVDNKDQTHSLVCDDCGKVLEGPVSCIYVNGKCAVCGSEEPAKCEHTKKIYTPVADGKTHEISCADCGKTLKEWEAHDFVDGVCSKCGYEEPVEPCKHEHTIWVWDEANGAHYLLCEDCTDILTDPEACTYEDGVCTVCGGLEHPEIDPDLDDVPKTGSFFLEWLYCLIF